MKTLKRLSLLLLIIVVFTYPFDSIPANASSQVRSEKKGLALTGSQIDDVELLGASWWYVYSVWEDHLADPRYIPMLCDGLPDPDLPESWPGEILVFTEPSIQNISPTEGAERYLALRHHYPSAGLILGGVVEAHLDWALEFMQNLSEGQEPEKWHVHHYFDDSAHQAIEDIKQFQRLVGTTLWVTEFGSVVSDVQATKDFLLWMESYRWIERYAYFPTRMNKDFDWFPSRWDDDMALVDWSESTISPLGEVYRDFEVFQIFLPHVR